jgi:hypothetical protein
MPTTKKDHGRDRKDEDKKKASSSSSNRDSQKMNENKTR